MTLTRLLAVTLLFCTSPAFAQDQRSSTSPNADHIPSSSTNQSQLVTPAEPWRIGPRTSWDFTSKSDIGIAADGFRFDPSKIDFGNDHSKSMVEVMPNPAPRDGRADADNTCYVIGSYLVARDSTDSDSTHVTGYSTCQPASRYRLKATDEEPVFRQR